MLIMDKLLIWCIGGADAKGHKMVEGSFSIHTACSSMQIRINRVAQVSGADAAGRLQCDVPLRKQSESLALVHRVFVRDGGLVAVR